MCAYESMAHSTGLPLCAGARVSKIKKKEKRKRKSEINGMKQWERPGLRVAAGCVMELDPIKLAKRISGMYRRSKLRFRYYRISFSCLRGYGSSVLHSRF